MDFIRGCRVLSWTESNTHTVRIVTGHLHGGVEVVKGGVRYTVVAKALIIGQGVYSCYSAVPRLQILSSDSKNIHISLKIDHFRCSQQLKQNRRPVGVLNNQPIWIFHLVTEHGRFLCPENSMLWNPGGRLSTQFMHSQCIEHIYNLCISLYWTHSDSDNPIRDSTR